MCVGNAYLVVENPEEPYLHDIKYNAMPPAKRFRDMEQLSGVLSCDTYLFCLSGYI